MHLTPEILVRAYELLRATPPFKRWKLPEPDDIEFRVSASRDHYGLCNVNPPQRPGRDGPEFIEISTHFCRTMQDVIETMAHEMVHFHAYAGGARAGSINHGPKFKALARQVCKYHGFDISKF